MTEQERDEMLAKLTPKQRAFVLEYVSGKSATDAACAAGYAAAYAGTNADKVLKSTKVAESIVKLTEPEREAAKGRILGMVDIQTWWSDIITGREEPREGENLDRLTASRELARSLGGYLDRSESTVDMHLKIGLQPTQLRRIAETLIVEAGPDAGD